MWASDRDAQRTEDEIVPDIDTLTAGLAAALRDSGAGEGAVTVERRRWNESASTFASEIVTCRLDDGAELDVFCKYGVAYVDAQLGHRRGVPYEVEVYRHVLPCDDRAIPRLHGTWVDAEHGTAWLLLEHLDRSVPVTSADDPDALLAAARWVGRFHAQHGDPTTGAGDRADATLNRFDGAYFGCWRRLVSGIASRLQHGFPWLSSLDRRAERVVESLGAAPRTVVHGELYPSNVLLRDGAIHVVDWESAGIGAGEIDLAALVLGLSEGAATAPGTPQAWGGDVVSACEGAYRAARWPDGAPPTAETTMLAARIHAHVRLIAHWLRFEPERAERECWLVERLRDASERLGVL